MSMPIDLRLLTLTQWLSPAFPVGAFAYSHGLETAVRAGWVSDRQSLFDWLQGVLEHGSGQADAAWLSLAYRADEAAAVLALNAQARAFAAAAERIRESERQGAAFARVASEIWGMDLPDLMLPIALGRAARLEGLEPEAVTTLYLQAFLSNLISAAQRLMPLGQTAAQGVLADLNPLCLAVAKRASTMQAEDISSTAFLSDIAAMQHETLEPRLFQS
jgi:urease accessory protein